MYTRKYKLGSVTIENGEVLCTVEHEEDSQRDGLYWTKSFVIKYRDLVGLVNSASGQIEKIKESLIETIKLAE